MKTSLHIPNADTHYDVSYFETFSPFITNLQERIGDRSYIIVTDDNVSTASLAHEGKDPCLGLEKKNVITLPHGEGYKQWESVKKILEKCFESGLDRQSVIVTLGGGVVCDLAGFAASIFMRGIPVIQCPTSLLAMVDASIGGKTGYNGSHGKNLIGSFHQPETVLICHEWMQSLPAVEIQNGLCEMVKHGILGNKSHFENLEQLANNCDKHPENNLSELSKLIEDSVQIKANIVQNDAKESMERMKLNLGHTFGHAIEKLSNYEIPHGQAVAIGTVLAAQYAHEKGICDDETVGRIENIFHQFGIDTICPFEKEELWKEMAHDKKKLGKSLNLILPTKIGEVVVYPKMLK